MTPDGARNFGDILRQRALERPDARAFVFLDRHGNVAEERSYAQLHERARIVAGTLIARGLAGKPVLLVFPSGLDFVDSLFGCLYAGSIAVPAPYSIGKRTGERIAAISVDCRPAAALTLSRFDDAAEIRGGIRRRLPDLDFLHVDTMDAAQATDGPSCLVERDDTALLQYTSGSVSAPKGVILSHGNLVANNAMMYEAFGHDAESRGVSWLPLFHDMGLIGHVLHPVYRGGLVVLMAPQSFLQRPYLWLKAISDWRANTSGGPNHAYELCTRLIRPDQARSLDLSSWSVAYCGAEMIRADVLNRFADMFAPSGFRREALYPCYGLAEATLMVSGSVTGAGMRTRTMRAGEATKNVVSCGRPAKGTKVRVVDSASSGAASDGAVGEVWVAGPNVGRGYWRRPGETAETFGARLEADDAEYLRTGDLGFLEDGQLFIVGRIKDTIIVRGSNHAPEDIEKSVAASHPMFLDFAGAAFGTTVGGEEQVVVVQEIRRTEDPADLDSPVQRAFESVTAEHGLRLYDVVLVRQGAIPRTSSGKIRRGRCREMYQANEFERLNSPATLKPLGVNVILAAG